MNCPICFSASTCFFAQKDMYIFYRCSQCKTIFLESLPSQKKIKGYYLKQFSYNVGLQNEKIIRYRSSLILRRIKRLYPLAKTLCDVGSGYGFFLDEAQAQGFRVVGIEPSESMAHYSKNKYGIPTFTGELKSFIANSHKQYDVVSCIHVIEHVVNPREFITSLLKLVKLGGILYLETPNSDSHLLYAEKEDYTFLIPPDHLWLFSRYSIKWLLPKWEQILYINTYSYSEHFMGILKKILINLSLRAKYISAKQSQEITSSSLIPRDDRLTKNLTYLLFDRILAPICTGLLNTYHKGSILELYIRKKKDKSGL